MRRTIFSIIFLSLALCVLTGCSDFDRDWDRLANTKPTNTMDITGRWQGSWVSDVNGHSGGLRCIMSRVDDYTYHARYAATYGGFLHFNYEMDLTSVRESDWIRFAGQADLGGVAGGVYHYDGHANADKFTATYKSSADHGSFDMKRVVPAAAPPPPNTSSK